MKMLDKLRQFIYDSLSDFVIDENGTCKDISAKSIAYLVENRNQYPNALNLGKEILKIKSSDERFEFENSCVGVSVLNEILSDPEYSHESGYIVCNKFFHVKIVVLNDKVHFLTDSQMSDICNMGIGIYRFKFLFTHLLHDVLCEGSHLNMDPTNGSFCISNDIKGKIISKQVVRSIEFMMSQMNLDQAYYYDGELRQQIERVLHER